MTGDYRILVAIDLKAGTDRLLAEAERYGRALNAIIDIVHVAEPDPDFVGYLKRPVPGNESQEDMIRESHAAALRTEHQQTQAIAATLRANGIHVDQALAVQGPTLETILALVRKLESDLLMLGSHHHGALYRFWYGDTITKVAHKAPCSLLIVY